MSGGEILILGKLLLTFGVLLGLPAWELWRLKSEKRKIERSSTASSMGRWPGSCSFRSSPIDPRQQ